ncbi:hypothetical protein [Serratia marcescens]|uniref:hypothetical protein n=1 Tax=Serratia marcescens TaxID=615 RepID=UPI000A79EB17|nr:hypothetical protein [Serratia marcescens]
MIDKVPEAATQELVRQLYPDLKNMLISVCRKIAKPIRKANAKRYKSPLELLEDLKENKIKADSLIALECKPSMFGPFLRNHLMPYLNGSNDQMRLGPPILCDNPAMQIIAQTTSHLKPVGIFPKIDNEISQICLYPSDATCCGMIGILPEVNSLVVSIPAISSQSKLTHCDSPSIVIGVVRMITRSMFEEKGIPVELYEEYRKNGNIWFIDIFSEGTEIKPMFDGAVTELWGGIYASGHLEFNGKLDASNLYRRIMDSFVAAGLQVQYSENQAERRDVCIWSPGLRFMLVPGSANYSLHMDADLALDYAASKNKFDKICNEILTNINESLEEASIKLENPFDLDFSYIDSARTFSILNSPRAESITDPLAISIRDWHRLKNKSTN